MKPQEISARKHQKPCHHVARERPVLPQIGAFEKLFNSTCADCRGTCLAGKGSIKSVALFKGLGWLSWKIYYQSRPVGDVFVIFSRLFQLENREWLRLKDFLLLNLTPDRSGFSCCTLGPGSPIARPPNETNAPLKGQCLGPFAVTGRSFNGCSGLFDAFVADFSSQAKWEMPPVVHGLKPPVLLGSCWPRCSPWWMPGLLCLGSQVDGQDSERFRFKKDPGVSKGFCLEVFKYLRASKKHGIFVTPGYRI